MTRQQAHPPPRGSTAALAICAICTYAASLLLVLIPLQAHVAVLSWTSLLLAAAWALATMPSRAWNLPTLLRQRSMEAALLAWLIVAAAGCAIDGVMGLWHHEGLRTFRQDGKLALMPVMLGLLVVVCRGQQAGSPGEPRWWCRPPAAGVWAAALALQMVMAALVAMQVPRAHLPITPLPWATGVALGVAAVLPLCGHADGVVAKHWRHWLMAAVAAGVVAVVASRSRSAWLVLPWVCVWAIAMSKRPWRTAAGAFVIAATALAVGVLHDAGQPEQVERGFRLLDLWDEFQGLTQPQVGTSTGSRMLLWQAAWDSLWAHPWTGIGAAQRMALVQTVVPPADMPNVAPLVHVHQQFLNQAVDHGLPGLVAALLSAAGLAVCAWRMPAGTLRWQMAGLAVVHVGGLLFNANMTHGPYVFWLAVTAAAIVLMHAQPSAST